uniref:Uncharacterized protein n=1 Tax=viral metagenome TaxID=1070528 RepID=A0A6M3IIW1_9ZZZZ
MPGGFQGALSPEEKIEILNAQISELEARKNNLQKEIETHYREYKNRLELDYNIRSGQLDNLFNSRVTNLDKREAGIKKKEEFLNSTEETLKSEIETAFNKVKDRQSELSFVIAKTKEDGEMIKAEYRELTEKLQLDRIKLNNVWTDIKQKEQAIIRLQGLNTEQEQRNQDMLKEISKEKSGVESKIRFSEYMAKELENKEKAYADKVAILDIRAKELNSRVDGIKQAEEEVTKRQKETKDRVNEYVDRLKSLEVKERDLAINANSANSLRNALDELQLTLNEKERYLILKERVINDKIKILQELRAADKK